MAGESIVETLQHKLMMEHYARLFTEIFSQEIEEHDNSKLESPEVEVFDKLAGTIGKITYGSDADIKAKEELATALKHHYAKEAHHPEHYKDGISDMNLVEVVIMFLDWKASSMRHDDGNLLLSLDSNQKKFGYGPELQKIFQKTATLFDKK